MRRNGQAIFHCQGTTAFLSRIPWFFSPRQGQIRSLRPPCHARDMRGCAADRRRNDQTAVEDEIAEQQTLLFLSRIEPNSLLALGDRYGDSKSEIASSADDVIGPALRGISFAVGRVSQSLYAVPRTAAQCVLRTGPWLRGGTRVLCCFGIPATAILRPFPDIACHLAFRVIASTRLPSMTMFPALRSSPVSLYSKP